MMGQLLDLLGRAEEMRDFLEKLEDLLDNSETNLQLDVEGHLQTANDICKLIVFARAMSECDDGGEDE